MAQKRENWASKFGVILAVAGSAVGLGNFLRFPGVAAANGGGAFLIPYFIAFLLLGIPLAWIEWTLGRYGGQFDHGSAPGIMNAVIRKPWAKYLGSLGIFGPMFIDFYYIYVESWLLGYVWYAINGTLFGVSGTLPTMGQFFGEYIGLQTQIFGIPAALFFFIITLLINFGIVFFGVKKGIEKASQIMMPVLVVLGLIMLVRVLTLPHIDRGLAFLWNPDFSRLKDINVWFAASGQIFFTLSVGIGAILTYASYVKKNQDITLSSLSANGANEFIEVIIGGTIVIPAAIVIMGAGEAQNIASAGTFNLGFITMPMIFGRLPLATLFQIIWFLLLFIGGLTSSISLLQPGISFCEDEMKMNRKQSVSVLFVIFLIMGLLSVYGLNAGLVDELDFWAGNFSLILFGTIMAVVFSWIVGIDKGWKEMNRGGDIKIPKFYKFIMKYITPTYLIVLLVTWLIFSGWDTITLKNLNSAPFRASDVKSLSGMAEKIARPANSTEHYLFSYIRPETLALAQGYNTGVWQSHESNQARLAVLLKDRNTGWEQLLPYINTNSLPSGEWEKMKVSKNAHLRRIYVNTYRRKTAHELTEEAVVSDLNKMLNDQKFFRGEIFADSSFSESTKKQVARYAEGKLDKKAITALNRAVIVETLNGELHPRPRTQFMVWSVDQKRFIGTCRIGFLVLLGLINLIIFFAWRKYSLNDKLKKAED